MKHTYATAPGIVVSYAQTAPRGEQWNVSVPAKKGRYQIVGYPTQKYAIGVARELAIEMRMDVTVMGRNGRIRAKFSYGNETKRKG